MQHRDRLIGTSRFIVQAGLILNRMFLVAVCLGFVFSLVFPQQFKEWMIQPSPGEDVSSTAIGLRMMIVLGAGMAIATDRMLLALARMIDSTAAGDPFLADNARRLRTVGWSLLALQLLDLAGAAIGKFVPHMENATPRADFSAGGWVAVLMVFILARIFAAGAEMREELAGTV